MAISGSECGTSLSVGTKQTKLAIEKGEAVKVFIAGDADAKLVEPIAELCRELEIPLVSVVSMRELGKACGIQVGAAAAAMVRK
ncbi:MAG: ribosomal L7Ae/L30e/S12e/Gadd45 family protein [Eubacteriales bacterium]|nr:ribosomal L7Ae/L30e/S12e/Gadd45 family protein [Eubacteriales bacterium]MDD3072878.1 ribosomal L7Ae/L30e/S12e/Gadd45 family protein [Eubacteriales bacterium]MDD4078308.1 ribosomal L7Ae/L30e/S12e/Gadd45 family protein [Eubacteriales bacterium]MDD4768165.1 ribosomal L7Ae/L30e/S12e/Gadd45 family protein [Eubacteriales bacterium]